ncbi:hypothetical protein BB934_23230 [Microvirga ossetica]|uniref:SGNH hydrolase-type esterase domain-containing protein n=1 Tax=Microvirga ossetica TaxID=1882682 RepID=A0A1B2ELB7_9HYPH|nr:GDSL-type esterase/lipase family protein [Microvirga ossetica]ANY80783.1 hypothetical protein BB934_23230 [Microvirga ossetica]
MTAQPNPFAPHWLIRDITVATHRTLVGPGGLLFLGDSLVEGFYWSNLGGLPVLNAGYFGIWTEELEPKVARLLKSAQPSLGVLLVGTNDAKKSNSEESVDATAEHFERVVGHFEDAGVPFIAMTPPPIEPAKRLSNFYSADFMASVSRRITQIVDGRAAAILDLQKDFADSDGAARTGITTDGIHLSAEAYRLLHDMLETTIAALTARRGDERGQSARR